MKFLIYARPSLNSKEAVARNRAGTRDVLQQQLRVETFLYSTPFSLPLSLQGFYLSNILLSYINHQRLPSFSRSVLFARRSEPFPSLAGAFIFVFPSFVCRHASVVVSGKNAFRFMYFSSFTWGSGDFYTVFVEFCFVLAFMQRLS